jgi:hypothetical protein
LLLSCERDEVKDKHELFINQSFTVQFIHEEPAFAGTFEPVGNA